MLRNRCACCHFPGRYASIVELFSIRGYDWSIKTVKLVETCRGRAANQTNVCHMIGLNQLLIGRFQHEAPLDGSGANLIQSSQDYEVFSSYFFKCLLRFTLLQHP